jgi:hypothetical protein
MYLSESFEVIEKADVVLFQPVRHLLPGAQIGLAELVE